MFHWLKSLLARPALDAGSHGERLAANWLKRERGFTVVGRNWRSPQDRRDEIDLVCEDRGILVFVEVKARGAGALVPGYHAIDVRKKRALRRAIGAYLRHLKVKPRTFRFDVVEVSLELAALAPAPVPALTTPGSQMRSGILHFENVPLFSKHFRA